MLQPWTLWYTYLYILRSKSVLDETVENRRHLKIAYMSKNRKKQASIPILKYSLYQYLMKYLKIIKGMKALVTGTTIDIMIF